MSDLPPLNALRAFDASARRRSFTGAAAELHVTHGAVSRQVKELERFLGTALFERRPRGLELTPAGRDLARVTHRAFDELRSVVADMRIGAGPRVVTLSTVPSLAARWLVPRMSRFQERHPDIDIRVTTGYDLTDFHREDVDIALRCGRGPWHGTYSEPLGGSNVFPVCSPALLQSDPPLRDVNDLRHFTLLHDMHYTNWVQWLSQAGADAVDGRRGLVLQDSNVLLQTAIEGQGIALAALPLVHSDLKAGRLVRPFELEIESRLSFHIVCLAGRENDPALVDLMRWLREEMRELE